MLVVVFVPVSVVAQFFFFVATMTVRVAMGVHMLTHDPAYTPAVVIVIVAMRVTDRCGSPIVRMLGMRHRRIQSVNKFRPDVRFFRSIVRIPPAFAL